MVDEKIIAINTMALLDLLNKPNFRQFENIVIWGIKYSPYHRLKSYLKLNEENIWLIIYWLNLHFIVVLLCHSMCCCIIIIIIII